MQGLRFEIGGDDENFLNKYFSINKTELMWEKYHVFKKMVIKWFQEYE